MHRATLDKLLDDLGRYTAIARRQGNLAGQLHYIAPHTALHIETSHQLTIASNRQLNLLRQISDTLRREVKDFVPLSFTQRRQ